MMFHSRKIVLSGSSLFFPLGYYLFLQIFINVAPLARGLVVSLIWQFILLLPVDWPVFFPIVGFGSFFSSTLQFLLRADCRSTIDLVLSSLLCHLCMICHKFFLKLSQIWHFESRAIYMTCLDTGRKIKWVLISFQILSLYRQEILHNVKATLRVAFSHTIVQLSFDFPTSSIFLWPNYKILFLYSHLTFVSVIFCLDLNPLNLW